MSRHLCQSILRLTGFLTAYFGMAWLAYTVLAYQGIHPMLQSLSDASAKLARSAGRLVSAGPASQAMGTFKWMVLGQVVVIVLGVLLVVWSQWIARWIAVQPTPVSQPDRQKGVPAYHSLRGAQTESDDGTR